ncbi:hypothetical protein ACWD4J_38405 [Streptomyces sp. NPDC002577]
MTISLEMQYHRHSTALVTADGVFVSPAPGRIRALFPSLRETA